MNSCQLALVKQVVSRLSRHPAISMVAITAIGSVVGFALFKVVDSTHASNSTQARVDDQAVVTLSTDSSEQITSLAWTPDGKLWAAVFHADDSGTGDALDIREVNLAGGFSSSTTVKGVGVFTPRTYLAWDGQFLWAASGYRAVAYDVASKSVKTSIEFSLSDGNFDPSVLEENNPNGGTWVSGLVLDPGQGLFLTRHGSPSIYLVSERGATVVKTLSSAPEGLVINGGVAAAYWNGTDKEPLRAPGTTAPQTCFAEGVGTSNTIAVRDENGREIAQQQVPGHPEDFQAISGNGRFLALGFKADGSLSRIDCKGGEVSRFALESHQVVVRVPGTNQTRSFDSKSQPVAVAIADDGRLAFATNDGRIGLVR